MAVPKRKRYKQVVCFRRSLEKSKWLNKHRIKATYFLNFVNKSKLLVKNSSGEKWCAYCTNIVLTKRICLYCYTQKFGTYFRKNEYRTEHD